MDLFHFEDYRHYILYQLNEQSGKWGSMSKVAKAMKVRVSHLSQMLKGKRNLSHEQAHFLSQYFKLTEKEFLYLEALIKFERASDAEYKKILKKNMEKIKHSRDEVINPEKNQTIFYSSWIYSGIQLATGIDSLNTPEKIAAHFGLDSKVVYHALKLLVESGLCASDGQNYSPVIHKTVVDERSPLFGRHKINWRLKALEHLPQQRNTDLFFTACIRVDQKSYELIMKKLQNAITEIHRSIEVADDELLACINLDCFKF